MKRSKPTSAACIICGKRKPVDKLQVCATCAPGAYAGRAAALLLSLILFAVPALAAPATSGLYLLATTAGTQGLGLDRDQYGLELGGRVPISRQVESWWSVAWATASKIDGGGLGEQAIVAVELDGNLDERWSVFGGVSAGALWTSAYDKTAAGARLGIACRSSWIVGSLAFRADKSDRDTRSLIGSVEFLVGRAVVRMSGHWVRFDIAGEPREGVKVAIALGVALR